jgi:hypothetical protein
MIKKYKIPTIIGIVILLIGTFAGVYFLRTNQIFRIGASPTVTPKDIRTGNLSDTSATISWITEGPTSDFISWGEKQGSLNNIEKESESDQKFSTHSITVTGLAPDTTFYYDINSEGTNFDNNGVPWQFTTGSQITADQNSNPISGSVITAAGQPAKRALVYVTVDGYLLSTLTSDAGNFVLQLGSARSSDLKGPAQISVSQTLLTVSVQADSGETASAQIFPQSANPIPPLVLGQVQDYRNLPPNQNGQNPNVNLNLPVNATQESKFNVSTNSGAVKPTSVILESINEGETVTSNQPQFFGKGPAGESITITVHSEEIPSQTVQIPGNGSWSYSPSTPLSEGPHSITVSWLDASGITRTLTRNFIVQAGEVPAFVATPSGSTASPTPTLTPTATPRPSASPTAMPGASASPTLTPTPTPQPSATGTPSATLSASPTTTPGALPATGDLTPTLLLSIMGVAVIAFGFAVWKISEN